ncbi:MAG: 50S ribosomal protein L25 [Candidatus Roizmanbacteria bacterium]|nr:50S ribosomal protein L25 [Candidatus Roizmanbacteria bacterium]
MPSKSHTLSAEKRTVLGKKVKQLRSKDLLPGNIYGKNIKSQSVQIALKDFQKTYNEVGETGLVELSLQGEKKPHHVLIHHPQQHAVTGEFLHVDLHEVALTEKMRVQVPVELIGESPAAEKAIGVLLQLTDALEVEALPTDLPEKIEIDISNLKEVDDMIKVSDITVQKGYTITEEPETVIVRINPLEKEEAPAPAPAAETPEGEEAAAEGEAKPAEGGEKKPEATEQKSPEAPKEKKE